MRNFKVRVFNLGIIDFMYIVFWLFSSSLFYFRNRGLGIYFIFI